MTTKVEKMYRDWYEAWNTHEVEKILPYVTDDTVYEATVAGRVMHGKAELRSYITDSFNAFPDFKIDLKAFFVSGEWVGAEWVMSGTFKGVLQPFGLKPTGKSFSVRGATITELRGDKLKRNTDYYDGVTFLRQIGVMP